MILRILAAGLCAGALTTASAGAVTLNIAEVQRISGASGIEEAGGGAVIATADESVTQLNGSVTSADTDLNVLAYSGDDFTAGDVVNVFGRLNNVGTAPFRITFDSPFRVDLQDLDSNESATNTVSFLQDGTSLGSFVVASASTPTTLAATVAAGTYVFAAQGNGGDRSDWDLTFTGLELDGAVVPLPASILLLAGALGLLGVQRRRAA